MTTPALAELQAVAAARTERDGLARQVEHLRDRLAAAEDRVLHAQSVLATEQGDVDRLGSVSMTRIWASLRGHRDEYLTREQAEVAVARHALERARGERTAREQELTVARARIAGLGDLDSRAAAAHAAREREVRAEEPAASARLDAVAQSTGAAQAQVREVDEAISAAAHARDRLEAAQRALGSAQGWSTYDTFLGGGFMADMIKRGHMDDASALLQDAHRALLGLSRELADVGLRTAGELGQTDLSAGLDVWFDNIFSDFAIRDRVISSRHDVGALQASVNQVGAALQDRRRELVAEVGALEAERARLLA